MPSDDELVQAFDQDHAPGLHTDWIEIARWDDTVEDYHDWRLVAESTGEGGPMSLEVRARMQRGDELLKAGFRKGFEHAISEMPGAADAKVLSTAMHEAGLFWDRIVDEPLLAGLMESAFEPLARSAHRQAAVGMQQTMERLFAAFQVADVPLPKFKEDLFRLDVALAELESACELALYEPVREVQEDLEVEGKEIHAVEALKRGLAGLRARAPSLGPCGALRELAGWWETRWNNASEETLRAAAPRIIAFTAHLELSCVVHNHKVTTERSIATLWLIPKRTETEEESRYRFMSNPARARADLSGHDVMAALERVVVRGPMLVQCIEAPAWPAEEAAELREAMPSVDDESTLTLPGIFAFMREVCELTDERAPMATALGIVLRCGEEPSAVAALEAWQREDWIADASFAFAHQVVDGVQTNLPGHQEECSDLEHAGEGLEVDIDSFDELIGLLFVMDDIGEAASTLIDAAFSGRRVNIGYGPADDIGGSELRWTRSGHRSSSHSSSGSMIGKRWTIETTSTTTTDVVLRLTYEPE